MAKEVEEAVMMVPSADPNSSGPYLVRDAKSGGKLRKK
jgi:hypothetical protein